MLNSNYKSIHDLVEKIRKKLLDSDLCEILFKDGNKGEMITACLDVIDDTLYAINNYNDYPFPESLGLKYLYLYGILQALFIQSDAVKHLHEGFGINYEMSEELKEVRGIRNHSTGHPTKKNNGYNNKSQIFHFNFISRMTIEKTGFTLLTVSNQGEQKSNDIALNILIKNQLSNICQNLNDLVQKINTA